MVTAADEATIVQAIIHGLASGWCNTTGSCCCCCCKRNPTNPSRRPTWRRSSSVMSMQEKLKAVAKEFFGHEVGISQVVKHLRQNGHADLAKAVTAKHKCRNLAANPAGDLDVRVRLAFVKTFIKKDPLMDNDPGKQKVAVKNVEHVVKETSSNDVAAERSEAAVAPASGTWEPWCCGCSLRTEVAISMQLALGKKTETSQPKLMPTPNLPSLMFRRSATRWISLTVARFLLSHLLRSTRGCLGKCVPTWTLAYL